MPGSVRKQGRRYDIVSGKPVTSARSLNAGLPDYALVASHAGIALNARLSYAEPEQLVEVVVCLVSQLRLAVRCVQVF